MTARMHPYLNFPAESSQALAYYQSIFGGELEILTFGQAGALPEGHWAQDLTMHASLRGEVVTVLASDAPEGVTPHIFQRGNDMHLCIQGDDVEQGRAWFDALAAGGEVAMPFEPQMWGDTFGSVVDKFGVSWLINISAPA